MKKSADVFPSVAVAIAQELKLIPRAESTQLPALAAMLGARAARLGKRLIPICTDGSATVRDEVDFAQVLSTKSFARWLAKASGLYKTSLSAFIYFVAAESGAGRPDGFTKAISEQLYLLGEAGRIDRKAVDSITERGIAEAQTGSPLLHAAHVDIQFPVQQSASHSEILEAFRGLYQVFRHASVDASNRFVAELLHIRAASSKTGFDGSYYSMDPVTRTAVKWDCRGFVDTHLLYVSMWRRHAGLFLHEHMRIARPGEVSNKYMAGMRVGSTDYTEDMAIAFVVLEQLASDADVKTFTHGDVDRFAQNGGVREVKRPSNEFSALKGLFLSNKVKELWKVSSTVVQFNARAATGRFNELRNKRRK